MRTVPEMLLLLSFLTNRTLPDLPPPLVKNKKSRILHPSSYWPGRLAGVAVFRGTAWMRSRFEAASAAFPPRACPP